ncbi:MAG: AMP-binding protein [Desulfobulbaceae bacterium]|nr:AMP-binding protein [Desulfobulbaceae bacterium]HIJ91681.1 AMP-binding protein [Deltaproteobacteria bacterium]
MISTTITTLNLLLEESARVFGNRPAVGFAFQPSTRYEEFHLKALEVAALLKERGIEKGDRVAILADNSPQWGMAYFGIIRLGAIAVPILPDFPEADVKHILNESEAKILFTTQRQLEKLYELPRNRLKTVITLDDTADQNKIVVTLPFKQFLAAAGNLPEKKKALAADLTTPDDIASIIYTSGTSGHAKAVMLSHKNFVSNVRATQSIFPDEPVQGCTFLSILPMSHAYEFTLGFLAPLATGSRIVYAGKTPTPTVLERICRQEQPTIMCMVPMIMEKIYKKKVLPGIGANILVRASMKLPFFRRKIMQKIGRKLQLFFGGKLKFVAIGGAALNIEVERFLVEAGFPYLVGYGLTETSPLVSAGPFGDPNIALGSAGKPVKDVEILINKPNPETGLGEILIKGPSVMQGYYGNHRATEEVLGADGWLATGDLGFLDPQGYLFIKGRSKSVIVLSHGENIYPEAIEEKINAFRHVAESLVRDSNNRLEALIYLDYELIDAETRGKEQARQLGHIAEILAEIKTQVNKQLPQYAQLAQISEHREPFTKTATHKIKRYLYTSSPQT